MKAQVTITAANSAAAKEMIQEIAKAAGANFESYEIKPFGIMVGGKGKNRVDHYSSTDGKISYCEAYEKGELNRVNFFNEDDDFVATIQVADGGAEKITDAEISEICKALGIEPAAALTALEQNNDGAAEKKKARDSYNAGFKAPIDTESVQKKATEAIARAYKKAEEIGCPVRVLLVEATYLFAGLQKFTFLDNGSVNCIIGSSSPDLGVVNNRLGEGEGENVALAGVTGDSGFLGIGGGAPVGNNSTQSATGMSFVVVSACSNCIYRILCCIVKICHLHYERAAGLGIINGT